MSVLRSRQEFYLNLETMHPLTARSTSAESKTRKGALPPSSREIFFTVSAHCRYRILPGWRDRLSKGSETDHKRKDCNASILYNLPTLVDPVKESAATLVESHMALPTSDAFSCRDVTTLTTPLVE